MPRCNWQINKNSRLHMRDQIWNTSIFLLRKIESHWYSRMSLVLSQLRRLWLDSQPKKKIKKKRRRRLWLSNNKWGYYIKTWPLLCWSWIFVQLGFIYYKTFIGVVMNKLSIPLNWLLFMIFVLSLYWHVFCQLEQTKQQVLW